MSSVHSSDQSGPGKDEAKFKAKSTPKLSDAQLQATLTPARVQIPCPRCKTLFVTWKRRPGKYCSRECSINFRRETKQACKPRKGQMVECPRCGKRTYKHPGGVASGRRFCSTRCAYAAAHGEKVVKTCAYCGDVMILQPGQGRRQYCSTRCMGDGIMVRPLDREHKGRKAKLSHYGYVHVWEPDHPGSFHGWIPEHRLVAEQSIGRRLEAGEVVHHVNGDKADNRPENLQVMTANDHRSIEAQIQKDQRKAKDAELARLRTEVADLRARLDAGSEVTP